MIMIEFNEAQSSCARTELENATTSALLARSPTTTCSGTRSCIVWEMGKLDEIR